MDRGVKRQRGRGSRGSWGGWGSRGEEFY